MHAFIFLSLLCFKIYLADLKYTLLLCAFLKLLFMAVEYKFFDDEHQQKIIWEQIISIFDRGVMFSPALLLFLYGTHLVAHHVWSNLYLCTLISVGVTTTILLMLEPIINSAIHCYAWKFVGKETSVRVDWWNGKFELKHLDISGQALDFLSKMVLTPSSLRLETFEIVLPWMRLFRGTKILISGLKVKMTYCDPNVVMYNTGGVTTKDGSTSAFIGAQLDLVRVKVAKDHFLAKQAAMVALANKKTKNILAKLKLWDAAKMKSAERIRQRKNVEEDPDRQVWSQRSQESADYFNEMDDESEEDDDDKDEPKQPRPAYWVELVDDIIAHFSFQVRNVSVELYHLPGELNKDHKHAHVGMKFMLPEISLQTHVLISDKAEEEKEEREEKKNAESSVNHRRAHSIHNTKFKLRI